MKRALRFAVVLALVALAGCQQQRQPAPGTNPAPLPTYRSVADAYNQRVANLDRLWTYTSVRFWIADDEGKEHSEALDANLQIILPSRFLLRLDKVGNTFGLLGSNDERYWWIELGDNPRALVGSHARVNPERLAQISGVGGLPVHPLDVIELLGITPLPTAGPGIGAGQEASINWSADGRSLVVTVPGRAGQRRLWLDPESYRASRIELLDGGADGQPGVIAWSELSKFIPVEVRMNTAAPSMAGEIMLNLPEARVRLAITGPKNLKARPKPESFDFDRLVKQYRVGDIRSLDDPAQADNR